MSLSGIIARRCAKVIQKFRVVYYAALSSDTPIQGTLIKRQPLLLVGKGNVVIKGSATVGYFPSPFFFNTYAHFDLRQNNARIEIGNGTILNNNPTLIADGATISIGSYCFIGLNFTIMTSDAHNLHPAKRQSSDFPRIAVTIGNNVFIGSNVTVLKGVEIGDNSVIGSGSMVIDSIPPNVIAAGVPCKIIKAL